jgi:hypothetical protein
MADVGGKDGKIRMRVIEYYVEVEGQDVREMFCLATDLDDWHAYPAAVLAAWNPVPAAHSPPAAPVGPWNQPPPRSDIRALPMHYEHDHRP